MIAIVNGYALAGPCKQFRHVSLNRFKWSGGNERGHYWLFSAFDLYPSHVLNEMKNGCVIGISVAMIDQ